MTRSQDWFGRDRGVHGFIHRSWFRRGLPDHAFDGRPVIGICNTWSEFNPCQLNLRDIADHVKRGVWEAGGVPLEFPSISLGECSIRPTAMLLRNLMSMAVEESIRGNPMDGVVLLGGCDKNTPAMLMGAASVDLPAICLSSGPMLNGKYRGQDVGSGTMVWKYSAEVAAGRMSMDDFLAAESCQTRSDGHCMTMGTASTMACLIEAMGMSLPGAAAYPAPDTRRRALAHLTGRRIVEMVREDLRISKVLSRTSFENAIKVNAAIGGSTNAVLHLKAIAGRVGIPLDLEDWDKLSRDVPLLVNLMPSGEFLMEEFCYAGGLGAVLHELADVIDGSAMTVTGAPIASYAEGAEVHDRSVIATRSEPVLEESGIAVLRGNLAPKGAILKLSAASPALLTHTGRAVVFESVEDYRARIDDPGLDVDETCVLVLKGCGPKGYPGMAEVGNMKLPRKLLERGVEDMVRISDARMSGTAFGTVILHTAPEAAAGGPLAVVRDGDMVTLDVPNRRLTLEVSEAELADRLRTWEPPRPPDRGWYKLYVDHVLQADEGVDLDFLVGSSGSEVERQSH
ncbi:MAG TPA: IlvD/Edd family dehydratase [Actinomycetota bacterium]|nr:IlvD/Edd family dehydratase [Actinomycetota bacterium]